MNLTTFHLPILYENYSDSKYKRNVLNPTAKVHKVGNDYPMFVFKTFFFNV